MEVAAADQASGKIPLTVEVSLKETTGVSVEVKYRSITMHLTFSVY